MSTPLSSFPALPTRQPAADHPVQLSPQQQHACRSLQKLSRRTRQVFLLSRLDGHAYSHIANLLNLQVDAVEQAMVRVLQHCRPTTSSEHAACALTEQASHWYAHLQSPHATPSQRIEFRHWLDANPLHLAAFEATERLWRQLQAPAAVMGASGWHRRKRRAYIGWCLLSAFLCGLLVTAEAFA